MGTIFPKVITNSTGIVFNNNLPLGFTATDPSPHITGVLGNQGEKLDLIEVCIVILCDFTICIVSQLNVLEQLNLFSTTCYILSVKH